MSELKTYLVTIKEVHGRKLRVRAASEKEALDVAARGTDVEDLGLSYDYPMYWGTWKVEEASPEVAP